MLSNLPETDWNWFLFFRQTFGFTHFSQPNCLYLIYLMQNLESELWTSTNCKFDIHKNHSVEDLAQRLASQFEYKIILTCQCKVRALSSIEFNFRLIFSRYGKNLFISDFMWLYSFWIWKEGKVFSERKTEQNIFRFNVFPALKIILLRLKLSLLVIMHT